MFEQQLLAKHNGVLWVTFSRPPFKTHNVNNYMNEINEWVTQTAQKYNYTLLPCFSHNYRSVVCLMWVTYGKNIV